MSPVDDLPEGQVRAERVVESLALSMAHIFVGTPDSDRWKEKDGCAITIGVPDRRSHTRGESESSA